MLRRLVLGALFLICSCAQAGLFPDPPDDTEARFPVEAQEWTIFGRPTGSTGIQDRCCMPRCLLQDGTTWTVPHYSREDMESMYGDWELIGRPPQAESGDEPGFDTSFCAVKPLLDEWDSADAPIPYELVNVQSDQTEQEEGLWYS